METRVSYHHISNYSWRLSALFRLVPGTASRLVRALVRPCFYPSFSFSFLNYEWCSFLLPSLDYSVFLSWLAAFASPQSINFVRPWAWNNSKMAESVSLETWRTIGDFHASAVTQLRLSLFWDVMLCRLTTAYRISERPVGPLKTVPIKYPETSVISCQSTPCNITEERGGDPQYRGADKSLARAGRKQATARENFEFQISYL